MANIDVTKYSHSPTHKAVASKDYASLKRIIASLPRLREPSEIHTESVSLAEEAKADAISSVIDRRDVPNRDTPLHLAVKLGDLTATEMLMRANADWSLQNEQGWSALQEAICNREEAIAKIIIRHYQPTAWAKWCRRLPRLIGTMRRMRDFYMEITFQFESSVIPFISKIAPSDTYKIWKRGANLRADMSLAGFDGFRIQRADQSLLFLGDGSEDGRVPPGSLCMMSHKEKEVMNTLDGAGSPATDSEVMQEVKAMSSTNIFRPGIDVTQAILVPQITWRRQEKAEMVGAWRSKVYDMHNVVVSIKSRRVPGVLSDVLSGDDHVSSCDEDETESDEFDDILTDEERRQLEAALESSNASSSFSTLRDIPIEDETNHTNGNRDRKREKEKKGWFDGWRKQDTNQSPSQLGRRSVEIVAKGDVSRGTGESKPAPSANSTSAGQRKNGDRESEYKKGLRPVLWLSPDFPLKTEELLPLLDILANKVKAVRRLRELLTTKLPMGTFPVKVAIPVIPTIRVLITFTKFEELQPLDEFSTPPSSPTGHESPTTKSWFQWIKTPYQQATSSSTENVEDPFVIPADYTWITAEAKKKRMQEKNRLKKVKSPS